MVDTNQNVSRDQNKNYKIGSMNRQQIISNPQFMFRAFSWLSDQLDVITTLGGRFSIDVSTLGVEIPNLPQNFASRDEAIDYLLQYVYSVQGSDSDVVGHDQQPRRTGTA